MASQPSDFQAFSDKVLPDVGSINHNPRGTSPEKPGIAGGSIVFGIKVFGIFGGIIDGIIPLLVVDFGIFLL